MNDGACTFWQALEQVCTNVLVQTRHFQSVLSIGWLTTARLTSTTTAVLTCLSHLCHYMQILVLDNNRELRWRDYRGPIMSSFFQGSHWFILEPLPNGHTRFVHGAEVFGLALPFIRPTINATQRGYFVFNKALRTEVLAQLQQVGLGVEEKSASART